MRNTKEERRERESKRISGPTTEQRPEELALAGDLRRELDVLLNGESLRSISFKDKKFKIAREESDSGWREGSLLDSSRWSDPFGANFPDSAYVFRFGNKYEIRVKSGNYGIRLTLEGDYQRIDEIVTESSSRANTGQDRPWKEYFIPAMHGKFGCLRPRVKRLEYGLFVIGRISDAVSGKPLLRK